MRNNEQKFFCGAPTYNQAKAIFWNDLKKNTSMMWKSRPSETALVITLINNSEIHVVGLDKPERIEGSVWHGGHITEMPNCKPDIWNEHVRPVFSDTNGWCYIDGVPEGRNYYYDLALYAAGGKIPTTRPIIGAYAENPDDPEWAYYSWFSSDVLVQKEIEAARRQMDPRTFRQEYEGTFESYEGLVYYAFSNDYFPAGNLEKEILYDANLPIYIGMDFNVSPMTATLSQIKDGHVFTFKGYYINNCNTQRLTERICTEYPQATIFYLSPCQSSSNRQTVAEVGVTDIRIMRDIFFQHGKNLRLAKRSQNPSVKDRINAVNSMLYNKRVHINTNDIGLRELIKDFNSLVWKEGTSDINSSDTARKHISDAFGYFIEYFFPIRGEGGFVGIPGVVI